jgi:general secretion pathway protein A
MYLSHYNLIEKPFQITTDPKFLWLGEKHQEALATLKYGVLDSRGFLLLTGDVGTGKTTLINGLLRDLDENVITATVVDPDLETMEFFDLLAGAFEIKGQFTKKIDFTSHFARFLRDAHAKNKKVLLIIDEAQRISTGLLEEIRLLSNIEKEDRKLLNIFFVGQDEFKKTLMDRECRALRQRIAITHQINPLTPAETSEYLKYRLKIAGTEAEIFDRKAIREIYAFSGGCPRLINIICDHALLTGFARDLKTIGAAIIKECARELSVPGGTRPAPVKEQPPLERKSETKHLQRIGLYASLLLVIVFSGYISRTLGHREYVMNAKGFYGQVFGRPEGVSPKPPARGIEVRDSQQVPTSGSLYDGEIVENRTVPVASDTKNQEPFSNVQQEARYDAGATGTDMARTNAAISEDEIAHDVGPISGAPAHAEAGPRGETSRLPGVDEGLLLLSYGKLIIPFHYSSAQLPEGTFDVLDRFAAVMTRQRDKEIVVKGYTDTSGESLYNEILSALRANAVKDYLVAKGVNPLRIKTIGKGARNPREPNTTPAGRRANRRAEIEVR